jgi:toxin YoeB
MITAWTEQAWAEYLDWQKEDLKILGSINELIKDLKRDPFRGSGNRSPLNMAFQDGGRAALHSTTDWFIGCGG